MSVISGYTIKRLCEEADIPHELVGKVKIYPDRVEFFHYVPDDQGEWQTETLTIAGEELKTFVVEKKTVDIDWGLVT